MSRKMIRWKKVTCSPDHRGGPSEETGCDFLERSEANSHPVEGRIELRITIKYTC